MGVENDTRLLVNLLDPPPEIPPAEARLLLREHIPPGDIRRLVRRLEILQKHKPDDLEHAREHGPEWLTSNEGRQWLNEHSRVSA